MDDLEAWVCEGCGAITEGVSPPDACAECEHRYFEALQDLVAERTRSTLQ